VTLAADTTAETTPEVPDSGATQEPVEPTDETAEQPTTDKQMLLPKSLTLSRLRKMSQLKL